MIEGTKNTAMKTDDTKRKTEQPTEEYHFAGGGEYVPITVRASSYEEALGEWEKVRKPAGTPAAEIISENNE